MEAKQAKQIILDLKEKIELIGEKSFFAGSNENPNLIKEIYKTYKAIFNKEYKISCKSCFFDCYITLLSLLKESNKTLQNMENLIYELRVGAVLTGFPKGGSDKDCSNANITNELAEWHLKNNPGIEKHFTKLPTDWKERISRLVEEIPKNPIKKTKEVKGQSFEVKGKSYKEIKAIARGLQKEGKISQSIMIDHKKQSELLDLIEKA